MSAWLAAVCAAAVALLVPGRPGQRRLVTLARAPVPAPRKISTASTGSRASLLAAAAAGVAVFALLGSPVGLLAGPATFCVLVRALRRLEPAAVRRRREQTARDAPVALDLLAACLAAGSGVAAALRVVARAVGGPVGAELAAVEHALALGAAPAEAWSVVSADALRPAGRAFARALASGAPLADAAADLAADQRAAARSDGEAAARRAGVRAVAPLGVCFLPAFVLTAVVPVIAGLAARVLG